MRDRSGDFEHQLICNRCGHCCEQGGECSLRLWIGDHPVGFTGRCELLTDQNECSVMSRMRELNRWSEIVRFTDVRGSCDFPHLREELVHPDARDYQ